VAALLVGGLAPRLWLAFSFYGVPNDINAYHLVWSALQTDALHVYSTVNATIGAYGLRLFHWPYPPGFFPWIAAAGTLSASTAIPFYAWIKLPAVYADCVIALLIQWYLGLQGVTKRRRLAAFALVMFGPSFWLISGFHGQFDAFAILPALFAFVLWERLSGERRAVAAGSLIGVAGALKLVPLAMALALLPTARSRREGAALLLLPPALLAISLTPFALADPHGVMALRSFQGLPGIGGISLLIQPRFARFWLYNVPTNLSAATLALIRVGGLWNEAIVLLVGLLLFLRHTPAATAAVLIWLAVYSFGSAFAMQYLVWGLPFFLLANKIEWVAVIEALIVVPLILLYGHVAIPHGLAVYVAFMGLIWLIFVYWFLRTGWSVLRAVAH